MRPGSGVMLVQGIQAQIYNANLMIRNESFMEGDWRRRGTLDREKDRARLIRIQGRPCSLEEPR